MSVKLKISVTKEILENSKFCSDANGQKVGTNCAISLSIRDVFPCAFVSNDAICFLSEDWKDMGGVIFTVNEVELPNEAKDFIAEFDMAEPEERVLMDELDFEIEVPQRVINSINIDELKPLLENHPTLELIST